MPKAKIEFLQASWLDIDRISDFYLREVGPVSAEKAIDEIMEHIGILGEHPYAGPLHPDPVLAKQEYRKLVLTKTYIAVYRVIGDTVYIYRVVNGKTDYPSLFKWFSARGLFLYRSSPSFLHLTIAPCFSPFCQ